MDQLRIGIIGYGMRGYIGQYWHQFEGRSVVTAVADLDDAQLVKAQEAFGADVFVTKDYHELLKRDDVDAVAILSPDYLHIEHVLAALEANKHIYLEKPMAIHIEDCQTIIEAWQKTDVKLMIGFNMRYMSMYQTMKYYIDQGFIGDVKAIWVRHFVGFGGRYYYQDWHRNAKYTNSLLLQKASHDIDVIHMLAGSYTKRVSAFGSLDFYNDEANFQADKLVHNEEAEIDVEDNNVLIMDLANGVKAAYLQNHFTPEYSRNYTVIGTKGRIENDDINQKIFIKTRQTDSLHDQSDLEIQMKETTGSHGGADPQICQAFVEYVLDDKEPRASVADGMMSVVVGVKATESVRSNGQVFDLSEYLQYLQDTFQSKD
ncbi:Gfo/Idh/MocA family protein [Fundicoccus culcitae]|uniref:Gfo/Idh/MocA family oxidoreductase n=1 Tax=Fundicoccus culcitae TaxID=2969821 RepID=A0ABY5P3N8_9LACT|nr:Gfo/Idh/MocA family oxidoreductase [Fundicoccus culcitae]UUX33030.1 Gfo/Idh/MocA family oxidoreductase [Fundicoccus culcitae]